MIYFDIFDIYFDICLIYILIYFDILKKEFIGPGLHLGPVHAEHAQPPFQWTLSSVFSAYENKIK